MKTLIKCSIAFLIAITAIPLSAQNLVIDDKAEILTPSLESKLEKKFLESDINYTSVVDFKRKCDYLFGSFYLENGFLSASLKDCDNKLIGIKTFGSAINRASEDEKVILFYYAFLEFIKNPLSQEQIKETESKPNEAQEVEFDPDVSEHDSRYFFAPSARPLKKSELYYNTIYFVIHDIQYGVNDRLSIGMGSTIIGLPFYFSAKFSIPVNEKSYFALGDLMILGTYDTDFFGNLAYTSYTYGSSRKNMTLGLGLLTTNENFLGRNGSLVANFNSMVELGKYFFFTTENYFTTFDRREVIYRDVFNPDGSYAYSENADFIQKNNIILGITGIRFVTKKNSLVSWQVGLTYFLNVRNDPPAPYNQPSWSNYYYESKVNFITFPTVSFTRKFKLR